MSDYAVITIGGKQYRVREGERLLVDRLPYEEGKTFHPDLLMIGGNDDPKLGPDALKGRQVTVKVAGHLLGEKVVIGKHRRRTGYRRRNGFRARLSQIEIQSIGRKATRSTTEKKTTAEPATRATTEPVAKQATAEPAKKPAARKTTAKKKSEEKD